jgi:opacity protein-like surface antigen
VPEEILTDNGSQYVTWRGKSAFTKELEKRGIKQIVATPRPSDLIAKGVVAQLAPAGKKTDWTYFYGFGGGMEFNVTDHFALRFQADFAHDQMFNDLLKPGNTIRFSVGPAVQWGKNVAGR